MAIIPDTDNSIVYRGRVAECGTCGCKSNLRFGTLYDLTKNMEKDLLRKVYGAPREPPEGRLICPGETAYPDLHFDLMKMIDLLDKPGVSDSFKEIVVLTILRTKAKFKTVPADVED